MLELEVLGQLYHQDGMGCRLSAVTCYCSPERAAQCQRSSHRQRFRLFFWKLLECHFWSDGENLPLNILNYIKSMNIPKDALLTKPSNLVAGNILLLLGCVAWKILEAHPRACGRLTEQPTHPHYSTLFHIGILGITFYTIYHNIRIYHIISYVSFWPNMHFQNCSFFFLIIYKYSTHIIHKHV